MGAASPWAVTFPQLLTPQEYRPADHLTSCAWEGNVLTGHALYGRRRISAAERWEITAGTQWLEVTVVV